MFMPALLCATVPLYMPSGVLSTPSESPPEPQERGGQRPRLFTLPIVLGLLCTLVSASVVGTLDSTLDLRLSAVPLVFSATQVSSTFTASSLFGSAVSLPLAFLVNHISGSYRLLSFVTAIGFLVVGLAFLLLAPLGSAVLRMPGSWTLAAPNSVEAVYVAMILKAAGIGLGMLSMYPAMVLNVPDDPYLESRLAAMNSALYSAGVWARSLAPRSSLLFLTSYSACPARRRAVRATCGAAVSGSQTMATTARPLRLAYSLSPLPCC